MAAKAKTRRVVVDNSNSFKGIKIPAWAIGLLIFLGAQIGGGLVVFTRVAAKLDTVATNQAELKFRFGNQEEEVRDLRDRIIEYQAKQDVLQDEIDALKRDD